MSAARCQGCGAADGAEAVRKYQHGPRKALFTVRLSQHILGGFGERLLCQGCAYWARKLNRRHRTAHAQRQAGGSA